MPPPKLYLPYGTLPAFSVLPPPSLQAAREPHGAEAGQVPGNGLGKVGGSFFSGKNSTAAIEVHWFCVARVTPLAAESLPALIMNYQGLSEDARKVGEAMVSELFSQEEFHLLRTYMRERHSHDIRTTILMPPVSALHPDKATRVGQERPFMRWAAAATESGEVLPSAVAVLPPLDGIVSPEEIAGDVPGDEAEAFDDEEILAVKPARVPGQRGFVRLADEDGYDLPFTVWGYYSLPPNAARISPLLPPAHLPRPK